MIFNHPFLPVFNKNSKILLLGSFPSVISRKQGFYYSNPKNRFWQIFESLFGEKIPNKKDDRIKFLLKHKIALYDVALSCEIDGSSDSDISKIKPVDLEKIFNNSNINQIFINGTKAYEICTSEPLIGQILKFTDKNPIKLPSTSSANARFSLDMLIKEYEIIIHTLNN